MGTGGQALDPERLKRDIRTRIRTRFAGANAESAGSAIAPNPDMGRVYRAIQETGRVSELLGSMPPVPATFRARMGAWLVRGVQRALFWYTPQIASFQMAAVHALEEQAAASEKTARAADSTASGLEELRQRFEDRENELPDDEIRKLQSEISDLRGDVRQWRAEIRAVAAEIPPLQAEIPRLQAENSRLESEMLRVGQEIERREALAREPMQAEIRELHSTIRQTEEQRGLVAARVDAESAARSGMALEWEARFADILNRAGAAHHDVYRLKSQLMLQERRLSLLLEEARKRLPEPLDTHQLQVFAREEQHRLDALYVSFEDLFRGTREDIQDRLRIYLPLLTERGVGTESMPVLDVGCGRGEWLELLGREGFEARGLDRNRLMVAECRDLGLDVTEADVLAHLRSLPGACLGGLTGFHIIEHLPLDDLIRLLDETVRVLIPGGIALFETPNPENVLVGSYTFYIDPTHRNPLPANTMRFLAEARGLCNVEIRHANPYPPAAQVPDKSPLAERFNAFFYGPQDYAVIGTKA